MGVTADQPIGQQLPQDDEGLAPSAAELGGDVDFSEIEGELTKAKEKISGKEKPKEKEPEEPEEKEPEEKSKGKFGASEDEMLDQLNSLVDSGSALPETVFQVGHYNDEYHSEASEADVAFELAQTDEKVHEAMMDAVGAGADTAKEFLEQAKAEGYVEQTENGGYIITAEGKQYVEENEDKLGKTYESKKHGKEMEVPKDKEPEKEPEEPEPEEPEEVEVGEIEEIEEPEEPPEELPEIED